MARFEAALAEHLEAHRRGLGIPGFDCAVRQNGKELFRLSAGYADAEQKRPITEHTLYNLYSNTKVVACAAALLLLEEGKFSLEDPLSRYFPCFETTPVRTPEGEEPQRRPITLLDVFRMTAGFGDGEDYGEMGMRFYMETGGACPIGKLPEYLAQVPLFFQPGTAYRYGIGHEMLAALIELLTGESFPGFLQRRIFDPLGMTRTGFDAAALSGEYANQYRRRADGSYEPLGAANCLIPPILKASASGGLISTVDDYLTFLEALSGGRILRPETVDLMRRNHLTGTQYEGYGYRDTHGYGLGVRTPKEGLGAFGWGGASGSHAVMHPETGICLFYMQHVFGDGTDAVTARLQSLVLGDRP